MAGKTRAATYEENLAAVEAAVRELESGRLPMEEALKRYTEAKKLLAVMDQELQETKQKLTVLRRTAEGGMEEVPMEEGQ